MTFRVFSVFVLLALAAACGSDSPTTPTTPVFTTSSQYVTNPLALGSSSVYTFSLASQSVINVTFASLVSAATGEPIDGTVVLGLGTPSGATCTTTTSQNAVPALSAQIRSSQPAGNYCIRVGAGSIAEAAVYSARVTLTSTNPPGSGLSRTESFSSALALGGTAIHTFDVPFGGDAAVTLSTARTDQVLRLGLGLWDGGACRLAFSVDTTAGGAPQLATGVDAGTYCIRLRDHTAAHQTPFTLTISHP